MERIGALHSETTSIPTSEEGSKMIANRDIDQDPSPPAPATTTYPPNTLALTILRTVRERQMRQGTQPFEARPRITFERPVQEVDRTAMTTVSASNSPGLIMDANILIALCSEEMADKYSVARCGADPLRAIRIPVLCTGSNHCGMPVRTLQEAGRRQSLARRSRIGGGRSLHLYGNDPSPSSRGDRIACGPCRANPSRLWL